MSISVSNLAFGYPGEPELFDEVSFSVGVGERAALVGENGAGKSTILRLIAGLLDPAEGSTNVTGGFTYVDQRAGLDTGQTIRDLLLGLAEPRARLVGERLRDAEARAAAGDPDGGMDVAVAIGDWGDLGGYELEARWDASIRRVVDAGLDDTGDLPLTMLSGGEGKRILLDAAFTSTAEVVLLDEPDNFLDIPAKLWLERLMAESSKTVLFVSHDRAFLTAVATRVVTLEGAQTWVHGGGYATYADARARRHQAMADVEERWHEEERRLFRHMKIMKERAAANPGNAPRARAAETRWRRFADAGAPTPPPKETHIRPRLRGSESSRSVVLVKSAGLDGLITPFSAGVRLGDRLAVVGANGAGKSHLLAMIAGRIRPSTGLIALGDGVSPGLFTQTNRPAEFVDRRPLDLVQERTGNFEKAMGALARYGLAVVADHPCGELSGGQRARLEILMLEVEGHNLLLLDEPTANLDIASSEALDAALDAFDGTCVTVSHDRTLLATQDRFWFLDPTGQVVEPLDFDSVLAALESGRSPANARALE
jgi:ATPase subunit of ABC transporter with duplicated ATPase domains